MLDAPATAAPLGRELRNKKAQARLDLGAVRLKAGESSVSGEDAWSQLRGYKALSSAGEHPDETGYK